MFYTIIGLQIKPKGVEIEELCLFWDLGKLGQFQFNNRLLGTLMSQS